MSTQEVTVKDRTFEILYTEAEIQSAVKALAARLSTDYAGRDPLFLGVLNGCFMFMADLLRNISFPVDSEFMKVST